MSGAGLVLAVVEPQGGLPIGNVNLVRFSDDGREAALGYWLVPAARGRGLALAASRLLCDWGFRERGLERIELAILPENRRSHATAQRLGAERVGLRRNSHEADGQFYDMVIYALTPGDLPRGAGDEGDRSQPS